MTAAASLAGRTGTHAHLNTPTTTATTSAKAQLMAKRSRTGLTPMMTSSLWT